MLEIKGFEPLYPNSSTELSTGFVDNEYLSMR
jgi:hypothetical protein